MGSAASFHDQPEDVQKEIYRVGLLSLFLVDGLRCSESLICMTKNTFLDLPTMNW
jgi:hypothetical protein